MTSPYNEDSFLYALLFNGVFAHLNFGFVLALLEARSDEDEDKRLSPAYAYMFLLSDLAISLQWLVILAFTTAITPYEAFSTYRIQCFMVFASVQLCYLAIAAISLSNDAEKLVNIDCASVQAFSMLLTSWFASVIYNMYRAEESALAKRQRRNASLPRWPDESAPLVKTATYQNGEKNSYTIDIV